MNDNIVVHCKTREEWDFINENIDPEFRLKEHYWERYKENTCKNINFKEYSELKWYGNKGYKILSFDEWCIINNHLNKQSIIEEKQDYSYLIEFLEQWK